MELVGMLALLAVLGLTPGPNNMLLFNSGLINGYRATVWHILGTLTGILTAHTIAFFSITTFVNSLLVKCTISVLGALFLIYLGVSIALKARKSFLAHTEQTFEPMTFIKAFLFQGVNPKLYTSAISIASLGSHFLSFHYYIILILINYIIALNCWVIFGGLLAEVMKSDRHRFFINVTLGGILIITAISLIDVEQFRQLYESGISY